MQHSIEAKNSQQEHISSIYKEFTTPSRVLRSFTNISNTVIQTALSGQNKYLFEILQNADDAYEDEHKSIEVKIILKEKYLIVNHNGKGFDFNDVERICDYASQIEEVKATDLRKTGYKGLGFKSLFNLSDCIYIHSNGYSFRFDKGYWPDPASKPWQVIPIWSKYEELPLIQLYPYDESVNIILKVNDVTQLESQLRELVDQPDLLLYLFRINKLSVSLNNESHFLERRIEVLGSFNRVDFYKNQVVESTWLTKDYIRPVSSKVQTFVQGSSQFIYPEKIKNAKEVTFTFALRSDNALKEISIIRGICYSTLPTQLHLTLPYHINSQFILNLDRTQLHENEWNEFLVYQLGYLQFNLLKDLAEMEYLKNVVIQLFVREINHPYGNFKKAFLEGFKLAKGEIGWLPSHQGNRLFKLGEVWTDTINFFKQNFQNICNSEIIPYLINYEVKDQHCLSAFEANHFTFDHLLKDFSNKYYPQLTRGAYKHFITYLYKESSDMYKLIHVPFLVAKDGTLRSPRDALLEESDNPIPNFFLINTIDNDCLPLNDIDSIKDWLTQLGARRLSSPKEILQESVLKWMDSGILGKRINKENHIGIMNYLAQSVDQLTNKETQKLKENLLILTESKQFKLAKLCYFLDEVSVKELLNISEDEKISSSYNINNLEYFFLLVGVTKSIKPIDVLRRSILEWIKNGEINYKLTKYNYKPIIEFIALHFPAIKNNLTVSEMTELKKMPVLTSGQTFQKANVCYFDTAVSNIKWLKGVVDKNKIVYSNSVSDFELLTDIGVSKNMTPIEVIRESILRWIQQGDGTNKITEGNHKDILKYIGEHWSILNIYLDKKEKEDLKKMPILTESGVFRAAESCYMQVFNFSGSNCEEIPGLKSVISSDEFISIGYDNKEVRCLSNLGVRILKFTDIYEKYSDHLNVSENSKWFFSQLVNYWETNKNIKSHNELLNYLQQKFRASSCLLAKNGQMCTSTQLHSSQFDNMYEIDQNSILLLQYENLPGDLEDFLGFKTDLDLKCIKQLLEAIGKKTELGKNKTLSFFTTVLKQLKKKDRYEVKSSQLSLLSSDNTLKFAKDLYYFIKKDAICSLESCYLKRICDMSHENTLELAELCGVNIIPFEQEIIPEKETLDDSLKEFYLEILPFIVLQESKQLNEDIKITLKRLYVKVCSITLYHCCSIHVKYPFGDITKVQHHFEDLTLYVVGKWKRKKTNIHEYLKEGLGIITKIGDILDIEQPISQNDKEEWLLEKDMCPQKCNSIDNLLKTFMSDEGKEQLNTTPAPASKEISTATPVLGEPTSFDLISGGSASVAPISEKLTAAANRESTFTASVSDTPTTVVPIFAESISAEPVLGVPVASNSENLTASAVGESTCTGPVSDSSTSAVPIFAESTFTEPVSVTLTTAAPVLAESTFTEPVFDTPTTAVPVLTEATSAEPILCVSTSVAPYSEKPTAAAAGESTCTVPVSDTPTSAVPIFTESTSAEPVLGVPISVAPNSENTAAASGEFTFTASVSDTPTSDEPVSADSTFAESALGVSTSVATISREPTIFESSTSGEHVRGSPYSIYPDSTAPAAEEIDARIKDFIDSIKDDIIEVDIRLLISSESESDLKKQILLPGTIGSNYLSTENLRTGSSRFLKEVSGEISDIKWLSEKFVFICLQEHYINKYPNSQFSLSDEIFTLREQSKRIEIVRINASKKRSKSYDFLLKNEHEQRCIKVKLPYDTTNDLFSICHCQFTSKIRKLAAELQDHKLEDFIEGDTRCLIQSAYKTGRRRQVPLPEIKCTNLSLTENVGTGSSTISTEATSEPYELKWQCEKIVFTFLQDHYKSKYPDSQFNLSDGTFTLRCQSNNIEIVWMNASGEKGYSYDIILKKEGEVKRLIEVESTNNMANKESFNINHCKFIEKSQLSAELPDHKEKYCIYLVYNTNYSTTQAEELYGSTALYKIVLLKSS